MASARLSERQKKELVQRFRQGESTQALADAYGCSTTTVTRLVRSEMDPEAYAALRDQRQKKAGRDGQIPLAMPSPPAQELFSAAFEAAAEFEPIEPQVQSPAPEADEPLDPSSGPTTVLAIDDAEDFSDEDDSEEDLLASDEDRDEEGLQDSGDFHTVAVLPIAVDDLQETRPTPWSPALLPACAYLLVDKTVELQARPLGEIPELGRLPSEEQHRQALVLFTNPRQAKRQCGRTQRVIKLPDPGLLGRTAPYLLAQGISRVVIEGSLFALPEDQ
ncbi:MAG: helix-turn-helix domain-containing protein [Cyanobium sp.]